MNRPANLRQTMPAVAGWIDELRTAFGAEGINASIRAGLQGQPTFWASEGSVEVGTRDTRTGITLDQIRLEADDRQAEESMKRGQA